VKTFILFLLGLVIGVGGTCAVLAWQASSLMVDTCESPVSVDETIARLKKAAEADGWKILGERGLHNSVKKHTGKVIRPVWVIDLCEPTHAGKILEGDEARIVSVFMPCTISVHEREDGTTLVTSTNAKLLGTLFGGVVKEVMGGPVADAQAKFVEAATAPASD